VPTRTHSACPSTLRTRQAAAHWPRDLSPCAIDQSARLIRAYPLARKSALSSALQQSTVNSPPGTRLRSCLAPTVLVSTSRSPGCPSWSPISSQSTAERKENQDLVTKQQITSQTRDPRKAETLQFGDLSPVPALTTASSLAVASPVIVTACGERLMRSSGALNQRRQQSDLSRVALLLI